MKQKTLFVLALLFGLMMVNSGLNKFLNYMPIPPDLPAETMAMFNAVLSFGWLMPLIGVAELVGGILFIIPRTRALGALILFPVMVGILLVHLTVARDGLPVALVLWAILGWVMYENREKYLPLVAR